MNAPELHAAVDQRLRILNILCAALLFSVVVYVAVAWFLLQQGGLRPTSALPGILPAVLTAVGLAAVFAAPLLASLVLKQGLAGAGEDVERRLNAYQSSVIVGFAMREAAAVVGLVLSFLTGKMVWVAALAAVALVSMLAAWPKREKMLEVTQPGPGAIS